MRLRQTRLRRFCGMGVRGAQGRRNIRPLQKWLWWSSAPQWKRCLREVSEKVVRELSKRGNGVQFLGLWIPAIRGSSKCRKVETLVREERSAYTHRARAADRKSRNRSESRAISGIHRRGSDVKSLIACGGSRGVLPRFFQVVVHDGVFILAVELRESPSLFCVVEADG